MNKLNSIIDDILTSFAEYIGDVYDTGRREAPPNLDTKEGIEEEFGKFINDMCIGLENYREEGLSRKIITDLARY